MSQSGDLRISFDAGLTPHSLPREKPASVTVSIQGKVETTDGTQPPPLTQLEIELNREGRIETRGLPRCSSAALQSTSNGEALTRCRSALVGHGSYTANLASNQTSSVPVEGTILAFNGVVRGKPVLLLHLYGTIPVKATFIVALQITRQAKGQFGTVLSARIPVLAGGLGSVTKIDLQIGRKYSYRGRRLGYLSASCAAPAGLSGGVFNLARGIFHFNDGKVLHTTLTRTCQVS